MPKLTVQNAEIKTATVEVRTLTLSGKQVTLSVFRQIKQEDILTTDVELRGQPWGQVNYHPDKCGDLSEHIHVVWQKGSELRRCALSPSGFAGIGDEAARAVIEAAIRDGLQEGTPSPHLGMEALGSLWLSARVIPGSADLARTATFTYDGISYATRISGSAASSARWLTRLAKSGSEPNDGDTSSWRDGLAALAAIGSRYRAAYADMSSLPQLFIAV